MDWRLKALLQNAFSHLPGGEEINHFCQVHLTRRIPMSDEELAAAVGSARAHLERISRHLDRPLAGATFYEFGAGQDLAVPIALWAAGVERQIVLDIEPLARPTLIDDAVGRIARRAPSFGLARTPTTATLTLAPDPFAELKRRYQIDYRAPEDARATGFAPGSIDCITTTYVLEHIPAGDLAAILRECRRVLRPDGLMSFRVDYQDHYSFSDPHIDAFHFYRYPDWRWRLCNPSLHYQNRLRHPEYRALFRDAGLEIVEEHPEGGDAADREAVLRHRLAPRFRAFPLDELALRRADFLLRRNDAAR